MTDHPPSDAKKQVDVAIAIVFDPPRRQVLICQRKSDTVLAGYWELPGGKCDPGETPDVCAVREVREEVGIAVRAIRGLEVIEHEYAYAHVLNLGWQKLGIGNRSLGRCRLADSA